MKFHEKAPVSCFSLNDTRHLARILAFFMKWAISPFNALILLQKETGNRPYIDILFYSQACESMCEYLGGKKYWSLVLSRRTTQCDVMDGRMRNPTPIYPVLSYTMCIHVRWYDGTEKIRPL